MQLINILIQFVSIVFTGFKRLFNIFTATTITYTKYYYIYTTLGAHNLSDVNLQYC